MKKILMLLAIAVSTVTAFGQNKFPTHLRVGATVYAPLTKNVAWDARSWGQRVEVGLLDDKKGCAHVSLGYMQNKGGFAQMPVMLGVRRNVYKNIRAGVDAGVSFFKDQSAQTTYNLAVGATFKKWTIEQSVLRTIKDGKHSSLVGVGLMYNL